MQLKPLRLEQLEARTLLAAIVGAAEVSWSEELARAANQLIDYAANAIAPSEWVVGLSEAANPSSFLSQHGFTAAAATGLIEHSFVVQLPTSGAFSAGNLSPRGLADELISIDGIDFAFPLIEREQSTRLIPNDALFSDQWHLSNTGQLGGTPGEDANLVDAWDTATGSGVVIAVIDDGLEHSHSDLTTNYRPDLSFDFNNNDPDPTPETSVDDHGTAVAGVAAGTGNNFLGIAGAAFDADLAGLRLIAGPSDDQLEADALGFRTDAIDIYNNSWGPFDSGDVVAGPGPLTLAAIQQAIASGRGGLGSIYVWAAGNGGTGDNTNFDGYASSRYTIAVAAVDDDGNTPFYGEPGASILIAAPSNGGAGITTTTFGGGYTSSFGGTSSATPLASGVIALALEVNPTLTWRDVQHLLVNTARQNDPLHSDWTTNSAGHDVNHLYGFGVIDAAALVSAAGTWINVGPEVTASTSVINVGQTIPDNNSTGVSSSVVVTENISLESVEVVFDVTHPSRGNLEVVLTSPGGTESVLATPRDDSGSDLNQWTFTSVRHWDETSAGDWTLTARDLTGNNVGTFDSWQLNLYGTAGPEVEGAIDSFESRAPLGSQVYEASRVAEIDSAADTDTFTIDLTAGNTFSIGLTATGSLAPSVTVRNALGNVVASSAAGAGESVVLQTIPVLQGGDYQVTVGGGSSTTGFYTLDVLLNSVLEDESYGGGDNFAVPQFLGGAASFGEPDRQAIAGRLDTAQEEDWYWFQADPNEYLTFAASSVDGLGGFDLELYDDTSTLLARGDATATNVDRLIDDFLNTSPANPATYYVRIVPAGSRAEVDYTLLATRGIAFDREPNNEHGLLSQPLRNLSSKAIGYAESGGVALPVEVEPNDDSVVGGNVDDLSLANDLTGNFQEQSPGIYQAVVTGTIASGSDQDWDFFRFPAKPGDSITITQVGNSLSDPYLRLFDRNAQQIAFNDDSSGLNSRIDFDQFSYSGNYYIAADSFGSRTGSYTLTATLTTNDFAVQGGGDAYQLALNANSSIQVTATAPSEGNGLFENSLQPLVELFDDVGTLVASGIGSLSYAAPSSGNFTLVVSDSGSGSEGDYMLEATGASVLPPAAGPTVVSVSPDDGQATADTQPLITLAFDQPLRLDTLDAGDLLIDGIPTQSVAINPDHTVTFDPGALSEGAHTITLAAGVLTNWQNIGNDAFQSSFVIDHSGPRVISSSINQGDILGEGVVTLTLGFDEPLDPATLDESDVTLTGLVYAGRSANQLSYNAAARAVTATFNGVLDDVYRLEVDSNSDGFRDPLGNLLDGEPLAFPLPPNVSGDGVPGGDFFVEFDVDLSLRLAAEPQRLLPLGSLISESAGNLAAIGAPNDIDPFRIELSAGETVAAIARPIDPGATLSLRSPSLAGTFTANSPGEPAILPLQVVVSDGPIFVEVLSDQTTGYILDFVVNAAVELGDNDSSAAALLPLDSTFVPLGAGRYAAVGELPASVAGSTDSYTIDLSGRAGAEIDLVFAALDGQGMINTNVELLDPNNSVIATATLQSNGGGTANIDQRVRGLLLPIDGIYTVRVTSDDEGGRYSLTLADSLVIDMEDNDRPTDTLRSIDSQIGAIGYLGGSSSLVPNAAVHESDFASHDDHHHATPLVVLPPQAFLTSAAGRLTDPAAGDPLAIARDFITSRADDFGLTTESASALELTSSVVSSHTGVNHFYFRQTHAGLPVLNATINVNVSATGEVLSAGGGAVSGLKEVSLVDRNIVAPSISAAEALAALGEFLELSEVGTIASAATAPTRDFRTFLRADKLARGDIPVSLAYAPTGNGVELAWSLNVDLLSGSHWYDAAVSAITGETLFWADWVSHAAYNVFPVPVESPSHGSRQLEVDPHDNTSSPFGWHDTNGVAGAEFTITQGNNVSAYLDRDDSNTPDANSQPDGGASLTFDFPLDLGLAPDGYQPAAVTNLFYWNNVIHDVLYQYGFDEASGNFQENNYGNGGIGSDAVLAEAQDGADIGNFGNANFATPPDGSNPRMQMFLWNNTNPDRDGDFDNGIIVHEYGHGVSNRLTGGAANASALSAAQSRGMGEGWSDWLGLMFTQEAGDSAGDPRGIGTYALGQPPSGPGIRTQRYSYDMSVNTLTYGRIDSLAVPHGVGEVWNSALWDLNWLLIEGSNLDPRLPAGLGFDPDLHRGSGGNNVALQLVLDGMKLQPANPSFLDARDAILQADQIAYGGAHQSHIWLAFARRGMGFSAFDGGSASEVNVVEAFDLPATSEGTVDFDQEYYELGDAVEILVRDIDLDGQPTTTVTVESGSGDSEQVVLSSDGLGVFRGSIQLVSGAATADGMLQSDLNQSISVSYIDTDDGSGTAATVTDHATVIRIVDFLEFDFSDSAGNPFDEGFTLGGGGNQWHLSTGRGSDPGHSADDSFYFGAGENSSGGGEYANNRFGTLTSPVLDLTLANAPLVLSFNHFLETEPSYDEATVAIIHDGERTELLSSFAGTLPNVSNGFVMESIDISPFAGEQFQIEFAFRSDTSVVNEGWYVDDVLISAVELDPALIGPRVVNTDPASGGTSALDIGSVNLVFSEPLDATSAQNPNHYQVLYAGPNGTFDDGGADDLLVPFSVSLTSPTEVELVLDPDFVGLAPGAYRVTVEGDDPASHLRDTDGNPLGSRFGPGSGQDYVYDFTVVLDTSEGIDRYTINLTDGDQLTLVTSTPFDRASGQPSNDLDPRLVLVRENGSVVAADSNSGSDGKNALLSYSAAENGTYQVLVLNEGGAGEYLLSANIVSTAARVLGRQLFYNNSAFDGFDPAITPADNAALATDLAALRPGETAGPRNISSFVHGINGIAIDVENLAYPAALSASDFAFRVGNDNSFENWSPAPQPTSIQALELAAGVHRIYVTWADHAIAGRWLETTLLAGQNTGLPADDRFYFGNAIGDANRDGIVDASDFVATRGNPRNFLSPATIAAENDFNRDRRVDATDLLVVRDYASSVEEALIMIEPPSGLLAKQAASSNNEFAESEAEQWQSPNVGLLDELFASESDWEV